MANKASSTCDKYAIDIVAFKRPTALDKLANTIPKPKGAVPNFGLPKWKVMPLESKIPMVPGPEGAYNFTRQKLGQGLWIPAADAEFNLSDPYCYEMKMTYDSLHDKHLLPYFSRPNNVKHLIKAGFITKDLDAKCSLRDYNMYRKYLRRLHCDSVKKELQKRTKWSLEDRAIKYAQEQAEKEVKKFQEREKFMELRKAIIRNRERAEKMKLRKQKEKQQQIEERLRALLQRKREDQRSRKIKSEARAQFIKQKQDAAAVIRREKIIQAFLGWRRKERIRKKTRQIRLTQEREEKRQKLEQKWEERQQFQQKEIEKEQFLIKCVEDQRKDFIDAYNLKIKRETERMKKLLKDVKMYIKCYLARKRPGDVERICCEKYWDDDLEADVSPMKGKVKMIKDASPATVKGAISTYKDISPTTKSSRSISRKSDSTVRKFSPTTRDSRLIPKDSYSTIKKFSSKSTKGAKKQAQKQGVDSRVTKKPKASKAWKGGKKKRRRKKKRKEKEMDDEPEELQLETVESISTAKTETSEASSTSEFRERCRCQAIKDAMKEIKT